MRIKLIEGDITTLEVDIIVNAANRNLLGGGGVDGAIHRAAGSELLQECRKLGGCRTGEVKVTGAYNLPAKWVIHTVGPIWRGGRHREAVLLESCYRNSLIAATELEADSIAFPAISTGVYGYPLNKAARVVCKTVKEYFGNNTVPAVVYLVCYDQTVFRVFEKELSKSDS